MKYPSISFFLRTGNVHVTVFDEDANLVETTMNDERFKRLVCHTQSPFKWTDCPGLVDIGPNFLNLARICSQEFADALAAHPDEIERVFKRCFQNIVPELAGAEITGVEIRVFHGETNEEDAQ
jgi:hypothetical protein